MGNNLDKYLKDPSIAKLKPQFSKLELYMLALLFKDLSSRHHGVIDKETFLQFFPLTGLWGERLFDKFDLKHTGHIDFYEFVKGIATCCHSTEDDKIQLLFSLYDMDQDGFIKKKEMITMLYNYPKDHIKFITDDIAPDKGEKLENLSEVIRRSLHDLDADPFENNIAPVDNARRFSVNSDHVDAALNDELEVAEEEKTGDKFLPLERTITQQSFAMYAQKELEEIKQKDAQNKSATLQEPTDGQPTKLPSKATNNEPNETVPQKRKNSSVSTLITDPSFLIATTVNSRVREYASFMFKNFEGANSRGKISYDEFKQWLTMHPSILKVFDDTFHQEIWSTEHFGQDYYKDHSPDYDNQLKAKQSLKTPEGKVLVFKEREPEHCGYLHKKAKKQTKTLNKRYVELRDHFLIYYTKKEDNYPKGIIFLDGCYIEETTDYQIFHKYGFSITHKSESYEPYYFYCSDKNEFDEWMKHLKLFHSSSIMDIYDFREKIGKGKFSVVFKAITKDAQKNEYAVKVIDKKPLKPEEKEFLLSETSVMKVLDHPNIIKLIDTIETRTNIYIVTELVRDGDLFDYIITRGYLEEYTASFIMKQLLTSVYYIHSISIAHRDIKPENIMISLSSNGEVKEIKIIDFGFAKIINGDAKLLETCGTPNYVAPEVLRGCGYDKQADVWSLGVIMYFMLRGYLPFDAHQVNTILKNTLKGDVPLNDDHWAKISPEGKDLLMKFLCKDPHSRIEIRDALKHPWIKDREHLKQYIGVNRHPENENSEQENA